MNIENVKFILMVQDMERAVRFYSGVIGLDKKFQSPMWSELAFGDAIVALHGGGKGEFRETGLSFQVANLDAACKEVEAGGGKVRMKPEARKGEPIKLARLVDTEGNGFDLAQNVG